MKKNVVILSHSVFINSSEDVFGPGHSIRNVLKKRGIAYSYIRHSLYGSYNSIVEESDGLKTNYSFLKISENLSPKLRYPLESMRVLGYMQKKERATIFIGINPLNALTGIAIRKIGKTKSVIFYTADYAHKRFSNHIMNGIYHTIDKFSLRKVDSVWNVSSRIQRMRQQQGLSVERNILVPNTPMFHASGARRREVKNDSLVLTANFTPAIDYELIVHAIAKLKKQYPKILLSFIGSGEKEKNIRFLVKKLHLTRNVIFLGYKPREEVLKIVKNHAIGLAIYANEWPWIEFGDSMKAREYLALGLPVVITNNVSTADDIEHYKAGFSVNLKLNELVNSVSALLSNKNLYIQMKKNALKLAKDFDFEAIVERELLEKYLR